MTQEEVAAKGLTYRYYQEIERGERNLSIKTLHIIASILNIPVTVLTDIEPGKADGVREEFHENEYKPLKRGRKPKAKS